jgi:hypothetical protein
VFTCAHFPVFFVSLGINVHFNSFAMRTNRRQFIRTAALSGVGVSLFSGHAFSWTDNNPVRLAYLTDSDSSVVLHQLLQRNDIDAIIVDVTPARRTAIALAAMNAGKTTAFTGPVGHTIGTIKSLLDTHQKTGTPCLLLDTDHFDRNVLAVKNMVRQQRFGEITHVACGTDSPTNGLGPAMDWLGINQGNRFTSLNASMSRSWGLHEPTPAQRSQNEPIIKNFELGEVLTINLQCQNSQTVTLSRDITGKRPHSRGYRVQGTKGLWMEDNDLLSIGDQTHSFSAVRPRFAPPQAQANQPEPTALSAFSAALKTRTIDPNSTRNALTISLIYAVAKLSLAAWNDELEIPDWFSQPA